MSGMFEGQWSQGSPTAVIGNLTVSGSLTVAGSINTGGVGEGEIVDALQTLNFGEAGAGVTGGVSGTIVDRGSLTDYRWIFDESDDTFKAGLVGSEAAVVLGSVGTAGYIPFGHAAGGQLSEDSNLFWDNTAKELGIGTVAPYASVHIEGGSSSVVSAPANTMMVLESNASSNYITFLNPATQNAGLQWGDTLDNDIASLNYDHNTDKMTFATSAAAAMSIDSAGLVACLSGLDVTGNIVVSGTVDGVDVAAHKTAYDSHVADATIHFTEASIAHANISGIGTNTHAQIDTAVTASTNHIADATLHFTEGSIDHGAITGLGDDDHTIYALADGTRDFTGTVTVSAGGLDVVGNTGLGIVAASAFSQLHVRGATSTVLSSPANTILTLESNTSSNYITFLNPVASNAGIQWGDVDDNDIASLNYDHNTDKMSFATNGSLAVTINDVGEVGIGTTAPASLLHIMTASSGSPVISSNADEFVIENSGSAGMTILSGAAGQSALYLGDAANTNDGRIIYTNSSRDLTFYAEDTLFLSGEAASTTIHNDLTVSSTGAIQVSAGTTAQRPTGVNGKLRYNSDNGEFEGYIAGAWAGIGSDDHGALTGLGDDDHTIYSLADGTRAFTGSVDIAGSTTETKELDIGVGRSGDGISRINLVGDATNTDYGFRIARNAGTAGTTKMTHKGSGDFQIDNISSGDIVFFTGSVESARFNSSKELVLKDNLVVASGKGIDFSATADGSGTTTSELLDDYEEGSWTPVFVNMGTGTYSTQIGRYTKIGNQVTVHGHLIISAVGTASGALSISGFPFTANSDMISISGTSYGSGWTNTSVDNTVHLPVGFTTASTTHDNCGTQSSTTHTDIGTGELAFTLTYRV